MAIAPELEVNIIAKDDSSRVEMSTSKLPSVKPQASVVQDMSTTVCPFLATRISSNGSECVALV